MRDPDRSAAIKRRLQSSPNHKSTGREKRNPIPKRRMPSPRGGPSPVAKGLAPRRTPGEKGLAGLDDKLKRAVKRRLLG